MDESTAREMGQWLVKARRDLRSAQRLYTDMPPLLDTAAYHCQQAAEKALKAFLTLHDIPFHKTHLLSPLVAQCVQIDPDFDVLADAAETLTPFATAFRYPGVLIEPEQADVAEAIQLAELVIQLVLTRIPNETKPAP